MAGDRTKTFKNPNYQRYKAPSDKKKVWRSLKQIIAFERSLPGDLHSVHYSSIDSPPSIKPAKKYSDISGLPAKYRDPVTNLHYASADEYPVVKTLPSDIVAGYLALRKSINPVG